MKIKTEEYGITKGKYNKNSCKVSIPIKHRNEDVKIIPIPYNINEKIIGEHDIELESNAIFKKKVSDRDKGNYVYIPSEFIGAKLLVLYGFNHIKVKSDFRNYIIKKAHELPTASYVSLPVKYKENYLTSFIVKNDNYMETDQWYVVDFMQTKPTQDKRSSVEIYLPKECADEWIVTFEDEIYEF